MFVLLLTYTRPLEKVDVKFRASQTAPGFGA